eukprot:4286380-Amphidinium_carterae.1
MQVGMPEPLELTSGSGYEWPQVFSAFYDLLFALLLDLDRAAVRPRVASTPGSANSTSAITC